MRLTTLFLVVTLLGGCIIKRGGGGDDDDDDDDVVASTDCALGDWQLTLDWGMGNCGVSGDSQFSFRIVDTGPELAFVHDSGAAASGFVSTNGTVCEVTAVFAFPYLEGWGDETDTFEVWTYYGENAIFGSGEAVVLDVATGDCQQAFAVTGQIL